MNKEFIAWLENSPRIKGDALAFAEAAFVAGMNASLKNNVEQWQEKYNFIHQENARLRYAENALKQQPDAGALVRALEEIREICNGYGLEAGKACDIAFHALDAYRGEK